MSDGRRKPDGIGGLCFYRSPDTLPLVGWHKPRDRHVPPRNASPLPFVDCVASNAPNRSWLVSALSPCKHRSLGPGPAISRQ